MDVAVVGAGIAGLACAEALTNRQHRVTLFDKGRGPGGRMSTRRVETSRGTLAFDHGAQYFTARHAAFVARVEALHQAGVVARWPAAGADAWVGTPKMSAVIEHLARAFTVQWATTIERIDRVGNGFRVQDGVFDRVVVAVPAEQAAVLLAPLAPELAREARDTPSSPCWTLMAAFADRVTGLADVERHRGVIAWAARNNSKPQRASDEAWVIQASADWSRDHLEDDAAKVKAALLEEFRKLAGDLPPLVEAIAHRWRYAKSSSAKLAQPCVDGVCAVGDWARGPRVEDAWLSGNAVGARL